MGVQLKGFKELQNKLNDISKQAQRLKGKHNVSFGELFNDNFMIKNTNFSSLDKMFDAAGYEINSKEDFEKINEKELNSFIKVKTKFNSWEEMLRSASNEWIMNKLNISKW